MACRTRKYGEEKTCKRSMARASCITQPVTRSLRRRSSYLGPISWALLLAFGLDSRIPRLSWDGRGSLASGTLAVTEYWTFARPGPSRNAMASTIGTKMHTPSSRLSCANHRWAGFVGNDWSEKLLVVEPLTATSFWSVLVNKRCVQAIIVSIRSQEYFPAFPIR